MASSWNIPGGAPELFVVVGAPLLRADKQVFEAMLDGWKNQQLSRNLKVDTVDHRIDVVRRFHRFTNE